MNLRTLYNSYVSISNLFLICLATITLLTKIFGEHKFDFHKSKNLTWIDMNIFFQKILNLFVAYNLLLTIFPVKQGELQIWSLHISCFQRMLARNRVLVFLEHHQLTQPG